MTNWPVKTLDDLCNDGVVMLGRGNIISKKDIASNPGPYPIYSSARENEGKFGEYGDFMFDEEMITWSIDGGGRLFYRPKHKFSVTNVGGTLRVLNPKVLEIRYLHRALENLHSQKVFDWVFKAHPSVIRKVYDEIPVPPLEEQKRIVALLDDATARITEMTKCYEQARTHANNFFTSALRDALESNPDWPVKPLGELFDSEPKSSESLKQKDYLSTGKFPVVDQGQELIGGFTNAQHLIRDFETPVIVFGDHTRCVKYIDFPFVSGADGTKILVPRKGVDPKYAYFQLMSIRLPTKGYARHFGELSKRSFVLPPLVEQKRIVARLDLMRVKTAEMVAAYDAKLQAAKNLRQSILEATFAGEL